MNTKFKRMFRSLFVITTIYSLGTSYAQQTCTADADCAAPDEECQNGSCGCVPGLVLQNDVCQTGLSHFCPSTTDDPLSTDCIGIGLHCNAYGVCVCDFSNGWYFNGITCSQVLGKSCPSAADDPLSTDCIGLGLHCNAAGVCDCDSSNGWHLNGTACSQGIGNICPATADDPLSTDCIGLGLLCNADGVCDCDSSNGWRFDEIACSQGILHNCPSTAEDPFSTDCIGLGLHCNAAGVCDCDSSNGWQFKGITCIQGLGNSCPITADDPLSTDCIGLGLHCNATGICDCDSSNGWHLNGLTCSQGLGNSCPFTAADPLSTDCIGLGLHCNAAGVCDCDSSNGWHLNGITCSQASSNAQRECTDDIDCVGPDERCLYGFCGCVPGLVLEADVCLSEIGRPCYSPGMTSTDCVAEGTWCDHDSTCQCDPSAWVFNGHRCLTASSNAHRQCTDDTECVGPDERCLDNFCGCVPGLVLEADVCVSEIGRTCYSPGMTSTDCVAAGTWCDPDSTCQCDPSAWVGDGHRCLTASSNAQRSCTDDAECMPPDERCIYGFCGCVPGLVLEADVCVSEIGRTCNSPGMTSPDCVAEGTWCDHDNTCQCDPSAWVGDGHRCFTASSNAHRQCTDDTECVGPDERCLYNFCGCVPGLVLEADVCVSVIGWPCSTPGMTSPDCLAEGTWCDHDSTCQCDQSAWVGDGHRCFTAPSNAHRQCTDDTECVGPDEQCLYNFCGCVPGLVLEADVCVSVIGWTCSTPGMTSPDCLAEGTWCDHDSTCQCDPSAWVGDDYRCFTAPSNAHRQCTDDTECVGPDEQCLYNFCGCVPGLVLEADVCVSVIGWTCSTPGMTSPACLAEGTWCDHDSTCQCDPSAWVGDGHRCFTAPSNAHRQCTDDTECVGPDEQCLYNFCGCVPGLVLETDVCVSVIGWTCSTPGMTSPDCLAEGTWCDHDSTCQCDPSAWVGDGHRCFTAPSNAHRQCTVDTECVGPDEQCLYNFCGCVPGLVLEADVCVSVIGWTCSTPGMTSPDCLAEGTWCDHDSTCQCDPSAWVGDGHRCFTASSYAQRPCTDDTECVPPDEQCLYGLCGCVPGLVLESDTCVTVIGRTCTHHGMTTADCPAEGTWCDHDGTCQCEPPGWVVNGVRCVTAFSNAQRGCTDDIDCFGPAERCLYGFCGCLPGLALEADVCVSVVGRTCTNPGMPIADCLAEGTWCDHDGTCRCEPPGWVFNGDRCDTVSTAEWTVTFCREDSGCSGTDQCVKQEAGFCTYTNQAAAEPDVSTTLVPCSAVTDCSFADQQCTYFDVGICMPEGVPSGLILCSTDEDCNGNKMCLFYTIGVCMIADLVWMDPTDTTVVLGCHGDADCSQDGQICHFYDTGICSLENGGDIHSHSCDVSEECPSYPFAECEDSFCKCVDGAYEFILGHCESVIGMNCITPGTISPTECPAEGIKCDEATLTCQCDGMLGYTEYENRCIQGGGIHSHSCHVSDNCPSYPLAECDGAFCRCAGGAFEFTHGFCDSVIGIHCIAPGTISPPECPAEGIKCDETTSTCQCDGTLGYTEYENRCIQEEGIHSHSCAVSEDCPSYPYADCDDSICRCAGGAFELNLGHCESVIGMDCINPGTISPTECPADGIKCDETTSTCQCDGMLGWTEYENRCIHEEGIHSHSCHVSEDCPSYPYAECDDNVCSCVNGAFEVTLGYCESVIGIPCNSPDECPFEGLWCDGATMTCQCYEEQGWVMHDNRCVQECTIGVSSLHDISRRLKSYVGSVGEPLVTDHKLTEGWYSLAQYRIINSATDVMPGTCGSFYQIILKDDVSVDWDNLDLHEVTLQATVVGLPSGITEDLETRVRKCSNDIQYYLMRPKTRFASYCFESPEETSSEPEIEAPLVLPSSHYIYMESSLNFMKELRDGFWIDIPYVLWNCQLRYYLNEVQNVAGAEFIRITWFADNVLIRSSGIHRIIDVMYDIETGVWYEAQLTELDLLEAGFSMGTVLRCGVQFSRTETSRMSAMTTGALRLDMLSSEAGNAGATGEIFMTLNNNKNLYQHQSNIPLGCARSEDSVEETCSLKLDVIRADGSSVCSDTHFGNEKSHELCGLTLVGLTRHGFEMRGNNYNAWDLSYNSNYENGTHLTERIGTHIMLDSSTEELEPGTSIYFSVSVSENTAGHRLWDGYTVKNIEITASDGKFFESSHHACFVGQSYIEATGETGLAILRSSYDYDDYSSEPLDKTIAVEESGLYIMLWSGQFPFTLEIEVETIDGPFYVCGFTVRYNNDVYTYSMCGGVFFDGLEAGDGKYLPEIRAGQIYIKEFGLSIYANTMDSQLVIDVSRNADLTDGLEGLCAFGMDGMVGRDGNLYLEGIDFLRTWRIEFEESQRNPLNQIQYMTESKYYTCGCPAKTDNVPNRVVMYENDWGTEHNVYTGIVHCNLDEYCTDVTDGEVWKETLLPNYLIDVVEIVPEVLMDPSGDPILLFICQFHVVPQYYYVVQWVIDDMLFTEVGPVLPVDEDLFTITDDEIYNSNTSFHLDMKMQCSVSVWSSNNEVLISPISSESFYPIQIASTDVSIMRGGDTTVSFRNFIPFECNDGVLDCDMEIKLSDPNDDCDRSSIAIKSEDHCGGRIQVTSGHVAPIGTEITTVLTIKNNDKNDLKTVFVLDVVVLFHSTGKPFWTGLLEQNITVEVIDKIIDWIGQDCHMNVDPHMRNMDGNYYENQNEGQFSVLKSKTLPLEVQAITAPCFEGWSGWSPTCACAAIIQAGGDIFLIEHCTKDHHFTGFISALDKITTVYEKSETRYQVIVPNMMIIDISVMHYINDVMNILILPSLMEKNNIEGLCGNFNGIPDDDFNMRDTNNAEDNDEFSMSWELLENDRWEENLLNPDNYRNPTRWNTKEKLCTCPNAASDFEVTPICSVNEEDTCIRSRPRKGRKQNVETRHKRDANFINLDIEKRLERLRNFVFEQHATKRKKRASGVQSNVTEDFPEEEARALCVDAFNNCPANGINNKPVDESSYLADCIKDVVASKGDTTWAGPQCDSLTARMEVAIEQDVVYVQNNPEAVAQVERLCPGNCNNHGTCNDGICQCDVGWGSENCLVDNSKTVEITYITGNGLCDLNNTENGNCEDILVVANGFTREAQSKVDVFEAGSDGVFKKSHVLHRPAEYRSFNEVIVDVTGARRRRSTSTDPVIAHQYGVSVSNDGTNFGSVVYMTVLDTACQETGNDTNGNTIVFLKAGFCYIDGTCYSEGNSSATSSCHLCKTEIDLFDWTEENCPTTTTATSSDDNDIPIYAIILGVIGGVLVIGAIVGLIMFKFMSKRRPVSPLPEAPPPYYSPRPDGPMNLRYYINQIMVAEGNEKGKAPL